MFFFCSIFVYFLLFRFALVVSTPIAVDYEGSLWKCSSIRNPDPHPLLWLRSHRKSKVLCGKTPDGLCHPDVGRGAKAVTQLSLRIQCFDSRAAKFLFQCCVTKPTHCRSANGRESLGFQASLTRAFPMVRALREVWNPGYPWPIQVNSSFLLFTNV